jgi:23S rRNA (guanosine2251-2'-O)-methyltransferase
MAPAGYGGSVEGVHAVAAAVAAGRVVELTVERHRAGRPPIEDLVAAAKEAGAKVTLADDVRPLASTTAPQGVVATCRPVKPVSIEALVEQASPASLLVVDHVEDPHNLGAIVRSAVAAGIPRLVVSARRGAPLSGAAFKAAAGALEHCSVAVIPGSVADAVRSLSKMGVWTIGLDAGGDRSLFGLELFAEPCAIVVGAEAGLHRLVRERVDVVASIPMAGQTESLNASVAAALACFELFRVRTGG